MRTRAGYTADSVRSRQSLATCLTCVCLRLLISHTVVATSLAVSQSRPGNDDFFVFDSGVRGVCTVPLNDEFFVFDSGVRCGASWVDKFFEFLDRRAAPPHVSSLRML